jgi:Cu/Ag efflux pump CusA
VEKAPGANTVEVTEAVEAALDELRPGLTGIDLDPSFFRPASYLDLAGQDIGVWLLLGALLAVGALALLLFDVRAALVAVAAVVLSLATAVLVLHLTGASLNAVVLAGLVLALAVLVDDAVLDVTAVRGKVGEDVVRTSVDVRTAALYAGAAGLLAALPVLVLGGQQRALYSPLVLAYVIAVAASTLVALTVTPALCSFLLTGRETSTRLPGLAERYTAAVTGLAGRPRTVLVAALVIVVLGLGTLPFLALGPRVLPAMRDPNLLVSFAGPPGTSLIEMDRITTAAANELRGVPGVHHVAVQAGRAVFGDRPVDVDSGELWVTLADDADYPETLNAVRKVVAGYPGIGGRVTTYEQRQADAILGRPQRDVTVRVYGQNDDVMRAKAEEIRALLTGVDGITDARIEQGQRQPTLVVEPSLPAAQRVGITPGDVRRSASTLVAGIAVGSLFQDSKIFDVVVRGVPSAQHSVNEVRNLLVDTPNGGHVRLGDVAGVRIEPRPTVIRHSDVFRRLDVTASVHGRSAADTEAEVARKLAEVSFPQEHHAELLTPTARDDHWRVVAVAVAAALVLFLLLQGAFGSWRLAGAVYLALPVALAGGLVATLVATAGDDRHRVTLGALAGLLAVLALVLRHAVLYVRRARALGDAAAAARERFGPVLTTTAVLAGALLPAAVLGVRPGMEIVQPLSAAVLGGLLTSAFVALVVVPVLYLRGAEKEAGA